MFTGNVLIGTRCAAIIERSAFFLLPFTGDTLMDATKVLGWLRGDGSAAAQIGRDEVKISTRTLSRCRLYKANTGPSKRPAARHVNGKCVTTRSLVTWIGSCYQPR